MTRVAFVYPHYGDAWLGGVSYLRNLFTALKEEQDATVQPVLLAGRRTRLIRALPRVETVRTGWVDIHTQLAGLWNRAEAAPVLDAVLAAARVPVLSHSGILGRAAKVRTLGWIPDLQHRYLPRMFSEREVVARDRIFELTLRLSDLVIVSSRAAQDDIERFYPGYGAKLRVLRFVDCSTPAVTVAPRPELEARYGFVGPYFLLPNQYWAHKNHALVLEALRLLAAEGRRVLVLSTGSPSDYRNPRHYERLLRRRSEWGLEEAYRVLGLVPHADLTGLFRHAVAIVNPSLFEGWSTTVEEAKSLGKRVLLSDIAVHREQAPEHATYFDAADARQLADAMWLAWTAHDAGEDETFSRAAALGLPARRRVFASSYAAIVREVTAR